MLLKLYSKTLKNMKNLAILLVSVFVINPLYAQRWSSAFVGKPESRALYASNVAKAIQNAWENELSSKDKKEMLLDEIIFGKDLEIKETQNIEVSKSGMNNIDEIEEVLGIKEEIKIDPVKKKKIEPSNVVVPEKPKPIVETEIETVMGNTDEVKEAIEKDKIQFKNSDNIPVKKSSLSINSDDIEVDSVYAIPEVNPIFPGGQNAMRSFFAKNIVTPESDGKSVKGKVFIRFMVKKNGEISNIYLVKGLTDACNKEAIKVIKKMPLWIPATQEGKVVNSWHTLPIYFEIE
jgi:TonB family protein